MAPAGETIPAPAMTAEREDGGGGRREPDFAERVARVVGSLRPGEVVTYGEVAVEAGSAGAARAVGRVMATSDRLPWWRVVGADGRLVPGHERDHARRLRAEGVPVRGGRVAMAPGTPKRRAMRG
jgi:methylated-DNA-protein-cysteine methyltransferase related protein